MTSNIKVMSKDENCVGRDLSCVDCDSKTCLEFGLVIVLFLYAVCFEY